jgi:ParB family chromosome partitioning protein
LGLDTLGDLSSLLDEQPTKEVESGGPQEIPLTLIKEDPNQPRTADNPGFSPESIAEIGETIKLRGVKSPISIRENQEVPGTYIINHGARRFRGSKWAGKTTVPAFIDNDYNQADQIIENLQRNELTAREVADYIGRELAKGKTKSTIAREIGKSPAFVTQHVTLLDLPEPIAEAFNAQRTKDVTIINELVTAYKKHPEEVNTWLADENQDLTRNSVKLLREYLANKDKKQEPDVDEVGGFDEDEGTQEVEKTEKRKAEGDPDKLKKAIVEVSFKDRPGRLILNRRPSTEGMAWIKYDCGQETEADLASVRLVAIIEG